MKMLVFFALLCGCSTAQSVSSPQAAVVSEPRKPFCAYEVAQPLVATGELSTYFGPGIDCTPPEGGELFEVGFGYSTGFFKFSTQRSDLHLGAAVELGGTALLFARTQQGSCGDWNGFVVVTSDIPHWELQVEAVCTADPGIRVEATLSGSPM